MSSTKIKVAVAGIINGLGNAIATALVANPSVTVILLARPFTSSTVPEAVQPLVNQGAIVQSVDYSSAEAVAEALQGVHTVISTIFSLNDTNLFSNLLTGAKAAGVQRFAPSEFVITPEANTAIDLFGPKLSHWKEVKDSGMEYTAFCNGLFMDYFEAGSLAYQGPLRMSPLVVDVKDRKAEIPGTGNEKITFTTSADIGKFVSAAVTWEKWPEVLGMSGETLSYNDVVRKAEAVVGEKFTITYLSQEQPVKVAEFLQKYWRNA